MIELIVICILTALNVFQFLFWSVQNQRLVDKLMSRDYAEYNLVKSGPPPRPEPKVDLESVAEETQILKELNSFVGGV